MTMDTRECVTALIRFPTEHYEQGKAILRDIAIKARQDEGCLRFVAYEDRDEKGLFTLNEEWADKPSLQAHLASEHVQATFAAIKAIHGQIENHWCRAL